MEVSTNIVFLCIGISLCILSSSTPPSSGRCFPCCLKPMCFGFVVNCSWVVQHPTHFCPFLVHKIMPEIYKPYTLTTVRMLNHKRFASDISWKGVQGSWRGISIFHCKSSLNSSLDRSFPSWEMVRTVIHLPPSQARTNFCFSSFLKFHSGPSAPPPPYTPSSISLPHAPPSPE